MNTIGKRIIHIRKILELSQKELAGRIGLAPNTVSTYEHDIQEPLEVVILSICREFNIRIQY